MNAAGDVEQYERESQTEGGGWRRDGREGEETNCTGIFRKT